MFDQALTERHELVMKEIDLSGLVLCANTTSFLLTEIVDPARESECRAVITEAILDPTRNN